jgi:prevent-host-death family protein
MVKVSVTEAQRRLPELIEAVEGGEAVTICRSGKPVVDLVPAEQRPRQAPRFGTLKSKVVIHDPDWWKPMNQDDLDAFLDGRD